MATDKVRWGATAGISIVVRVFLIAGGRWPSISIAGAMVVTIVVVGHCQQCSTSWYEELSLNEMKGVHMDENKMKMG